MPAPHRILIALLAVALLAACMLLYRHSRRADVAERSLAEQTRLSRQTATAREAELQNQVEALRQQLAERGIEPVVAAPLPPARKEEGDSRRVEAVRELAQAQTRLAALGSTVTELQNRVRDLEAQIEQQSAENRRLAAAEAAVKEDLESSRRVVEAMETELKTKTERVTQAEMAARKAREEQAAAVQKIPQVSAVAAELADVNRRRENTLNTLQRRYREITDQLRALVQRLDSQRDNPAAAAPDISRIQTAVQSAEEDLRQLTSLNTQAQRAAQKLGQK